MGVHDFMANKHSSAQKHFGSTAKKLPRGTPMAGGVTATTSATAEQKRNGRDDKQARRGVPDEYAGNHLRNHPRNHPRNHRRLARAIFAERDAVTVGRELLKCDSATVKARIWETLVNYSLGEFAAANGTGKTGSVQIVWDMPAPEHER